MEARPQTRPFIRPLCGLQLIFGNFGRFITSTLCGLQLIFGNFGRGHSPRRARPGVRQVQLLALALMRHLLLEDRAFELCHVSS